jgi:hypothetical protein
LIRRHVVECINLTAMIPNFFGIVQRAIDPKIRSRPRQTGDMPVSGHTGSAPARPGAAENPPELPGRMVSTGAKIGQTLRKSTRIRLPDSKYAFKICDHSSRSGCGLSNILPNVECGVLLKDAPGADGCKQPRVPVSGCFQTANAFGYHPAISLRLPVVLRRTSRSRMNLTRKIRMKPCPIGASRSKDGKPE